MSPETEPTEQTNKEGIEAIELLREAQTAKARSIQSRFTELGVESFPTKMVVDEKLQVSISIPFEQMETLEPLLSEILVARTLKGDN